MKQSSVSIFATKLQLKLMWEKGDKNVEDGVIVNEFQGFFGNQVSNQDWQGISVDDKKAKVSFQSKDVWTDIIFITSRH